jgi:hypothetical protein
MEKKLNKKIFFHLVSFVLFFSFVLSISNISALGIGPDKIMINFSSGLERTLDFVAINKASSEIEVKPYAGGELVQYIFCQEGPLNVSANSVNKFSCKLVLPNKMKAGTYEGRVGLSELSSGTDNVNIVLSVESRILVFVPETNEERTNWVIFGLAVFLIIMISAILFFIGRRRTDKSRKN